MSAAFLVIDKPKGVTSHDIVAAVRAVTGIKKVGHTGTLDPFATGVLPLALGHATRLIQYLDESVKVYDMTIALGSETDTGDPTGETIRTADVPEFDEAKLQEVLAGFLGEQMQTPPAYSAVKKDGKPLYHYARKGEKVTVDARPITIRALELQEMNPTVLRIRLTCSRGTYARVLAGDIANALGTAGHLSDLSRAQSGPFVLAAALSIEELASLVSAEPDKPWKSVLMARKGSPDRVQWKPRDTVREELGKKMVSPLTALSHLRLVDIESDQVRQVRSGGAPPQGPADLIVGQRYLVVRGDEVIAIAERTPSGDKAIRVVGAA
ncbi:MAG: tRNA pseudouridine55 synthase [Myxococcota bacterium]|jgi:tRNA pseudouridine55 synthase